MVTAKVKPARSGPAKSAQNRGAYAKLHPHAQACPNSDTAKLYQIVDPAIMGLATPAPEVEFLLHVPSKINHNIKSIE